MLQHVDQDDEDDHIDGKLKTREGMKEELFLVGCQSGRTDERCRDKRTGEDKQTTVFHLIDILIRSLVVFVVIHLQITLFDAVLFVYSLM